MVESTDTEHTEKLFAYVSASERDRPFVAECAASADKMLADRVGDRQVPESVLSTARLEIGANLYQRRISTIGAANYGDPATSIPGMRPALDPMTPAWPLLRPYLGPGLA